MSSTPAQRFVCPKCRTAFAQPSHFCRECGADMTHASPLEMAQRDPALEDTTASSSDVTADRRLSDSNQAWLGKIVDGRYRVLEVIGRGGMGVVYRVEHLRMGKIAAMKVLHRDLASDEEIVHRFEREASAISKLHHPHTVQVFDFGNAGGNLYLIMELVRGLDLARVITRDGPMPWSRAAVLLVQICGALQEAHDLGIVHRDLKPENVLVTRTTSGRDYAKVLDFGLAKLDQRGGPQDKTDKQQIVGTPYFMAPEQIRGEDVDARTDIYSFGALMFELLTGQHLYVSSTAVGVLTKHLTAEPDAPSMRAPNMSIPPAVDHLCRKALARVPGERWQSAAELAEAIEEVYHETVSDSTGPGARAAASRALAGGRLVLRPEDQDSSDLRLRRSDIDAFERGLKRRTYVVVGTAALCAVGAAGGVVYALTREPAPVHEEHEPNNEVSQADRIAAGTTITGYLGKRISETEGDRDTYIVHWPAGEKRLLAVKVTAPPNIDINVTLNDGDGQHGTKIDEGGIGEPETLHRRAIDGPVVITIGETIHDKLPVENVSDPYTLTVTEDTTAGEAEPNGIEADATPVVLTQELRGYLDTRADVDLLRWTGEAGTYSVIVRADQLPLAWKVDDGKARTPGAAKIELKKGSLFRLERTDRAEKGSLKGRDAMWSVVVTK